MGRDEILPARLTAAVLLTVAAPSSAFADGTISGTVRATDSGGPVAGQQVEV